MTILTIGQTVTITAPEGAALYTTTWWPKMGTKVTGTVQKVFKNGNVAVAVDQLPNRSADMRKTMVLPAAWMA
jgi:hypothetical protein